MTINIYIIITQNLSKTATITNKKHVDSIQNNLLPLNTNILVTWMFRGAKNV